MYLKRSPDKPIPRISDGTYVGEVSRLTETLKGSMTLARINKFQSENVKKLDPERSLMFSEWGMCLRSLLFRIEFEINIFLI